MADSPIAIEPNVANLLLDDELVAENANATRTLHTLGKHGGSPVLTKSGPEEGTYLFGTILREPDPESGETVFRMWYYAAGGGDTWVAYATSADGIEWSKPDVGQGAATGESAPNAVFNPSDEKIIGFAGVVRDPRDDIPDDERYRTAVPALRTSDDERSYVLATSPDGIAWTKTGRFIPDTPSYADPSCLVWDPFEERINLYTRAKYAPPEVIAQESPNFFGRAVALTTSDDFHNWSTPEVFMWIDTDDPFGSEIYGLYAFPCAGQWVGLHQIHMSIPELAYIDLGLSHSRDGRRWTRERELVLTNGGMGAWDRFNQCPSTRPVRVGDELWIYYSGRTKRHGEYKYSGLKDDGPRNVSIGIATIRVDGWCSMGASFDGGEIATKLVVLPEGEMCVNAKSDWGEIVVEVSGIGPDAPASVRSRPVRGDGLRLPVEWNSGESPAAFKGKPVQLRFGLKNALLYSWTVG